MKYKYSVVMTVYNEKLIWIKEAINSIYNQTYKNYELIIIIDNKYNKEALDYIKKLNYPNLSFYINEKNMGLALSLNKAISYAKGEYIVRMDADDIMEKNRIQRQDEEISKNKNIDFLGASATVINELSQVIDEINVPIEYQTIKKRMPYLNCFIHPCMIIRKSVLEKVDGYRNFPCAQDYDLFYRLIDKGFYGYNLSEKLLRYRLRNNSISSEKMLSQYLMAKYIRKLGRERKEKENDSYSEEIIQSILQIEKKEQEKFKRVNEKLIKIRKKNFVYKIIVRIVLSLTSKYALIMLGDIITIKVIQFYIKLKEVFKRK